MANFTNARSSASQNSPSHLRRNSSNNKSSLDITNNCNMKAITKQVEIVIRDYDHWKKFGCSNDMLMISGRKTTYKIFGLTIYVKTELVKQG